MTFPASQPPMARLPLRDELFLLGHDDDTGACHLHPTTLAIGLAGAALIDLWQARRITVEGGNILVLAREPVGEPLTDAALTAIQQANKKPTVRGWLRWCAEDYYERSRASLITVGILRRSTRRRLGLLKTETYELTNMAWSVRPRAQLRYVVAGHERPDSQSAALAGLVDVLGLGPFLYVGQPTDTLRRVLRELLDRHHPAVREITAAIDAAIGDIAVAVYR
jgi:hypothetical protein